MKKPYGRKIKKQVRQILKGPDREAAMKQLAGIPDEQLVGHLFAHFYSPEERIKFRAGAAMGLLGERMARTRIERARIMLRRIMWNLNDESGGIGWGSPEAMGEILSHSPVLAREFGSILFSYLAPGGTFIEHDLLQRGVIWGIGTYLGAGPDQVSGQTVSLLSGHLNSPDPVKRGYALRALAADGRLESITVPEMLLTDTCRVEMFDGWNMASVIVKDLADACRLKKNNHLTDTVA